MPRRQDDDVSWRPHDTGRGGIDPFDGARATRPPSSRPAVPPPSRSTAASGSSPVRRPAPAPPRSGRVVDLRTVLLAGGGLLAVVATALVFLTDDPDLLRVAVVAAAWAFVLATFVAGRRRGEEPDAAGREAALRRTYEQELEREIAARREYELQLENDLRRDAEEAMRTELGALRDELSGVTELRREVARLADLRDDVAGLPALREDVAGLSALRADVAGLAALRDDVAGLAALREEVARVAALREDVLSLTALRAELGQLGELRADLGRLRTELVEQLSSEMLIERIVMRTQAGRIPAGEATRLDGAGRRPDGSTAHLDGSTAHLDGQGTWRDNASWPDDPPRELTGGWPAVRLDEHPGTQQYERVRVERPAPPRAWEPVTGDLAASAPPPPYAGPSTPAQPSTFAEPFPTAAWPVAPVPAEPPAPSTAPVTEAYGMQLPPRRSRHAAGGDVPAVPDEPAPTPLEWLASLSLVVAAGADDVPDTAERPRPTPRRRRTDDDLAAASADDLLTTERPAAAPPGAGHPFGPPATPPRPAVPGAPGDGSPGHTRLEDILAESGVRPATGSRRHRRYRDDDGPQDDVLSRVLRGG